MESSRPAWATQWDCLKKQQKKNEVEEKKGRDGGKGWGAMNAQVKYMEKLPRSVDFALHHLETLTIICNTRYYALWCSTSSMPQGDGGAKNSKQWLVQQFQSGVNIMDKQVDRPRQQNQAGPRVVW
jgi:hypothetical protein